MNNKNKILVGCLALLLVLSVGYALFSETITINGTATAKGDFEITPYCQLTLPDDTQGDFNANATEGGYTNESCSVSGKNITSNATLLYPTAKKIFYAEMKNTGSINAVFKLSEDLTNPLANLESLSAVGRLYKKSDDSLYGTYDIFEGDANYANFMADKIYVKTADGVHLNTKDEVISNNKLYKDSDGIYYLQIEPGESFVFVYEVSWDEDAVQTEYYSVVDVEIGLKLIQQTDDLELQTDYNGSFDICINYC